MFRYSQLYSNKEQNEKGKGTNRLKKKGGMNFAIQFAKKVVRKNTTDGQVKLVPVEPCGFEALLDVLRKGVALVLH